MVTATHKRHLLCNTCYCQGRGSGLVAAASTLQDGAAPAGSTLPLFSAAGASALVPTLHDAAGSLHSLSTFQPGCRVKACLMSSASWLR